MAFPTALEKTIRALKDQLEAFGAVQEFRYSIQDDDAGRIAAPGFDDSTWKTFVGAPPFKRDQGVTWVRTTYTVPESCLDISLAGSQLRVLPGPGTTQPYFSPVQIYADGRLLLSETAWMDCKCPEGVVTESAAPGQHHSIAFRFEYGERSFWEPAIPLTIVCDAVEKAGQQLESIVEELHYMEGFEASAPILPKAYALLEEAAARGKVQPLLQAIAACRKLFEPLRDEVKKNQVYLITHAHIDMNWFWSMEETERIIDRDFTTLTTMLEENPDLRFSQSQCATYAIEEKNNPAVFAKMQKLAAGGQWDVTASTWVEGDLNMASGESIARHVLYSKQYLAEKFDGNEPRIMWCPDTFGHPASIPQVLKESGLDYYYFMRCGLDLDDAPQDGFEYPRDAHHVPLFWWKGSDGSCVLACNMVYGREFSTRGALRLSTTMRKRFGYDKSMFVFGVGDHGGGPTRRDIAWVREAGEYPTVPTLRFATTYEFYDQVVRDNPPGLPERHGEMNFVFDGCYTTHADIKYYNRRCENELEATENLCVYASLSGFAYPREELAALWKVMLFNQFHDILDGSGVPDSYRFSDAEAERALTRLGEIREAAMRHLAGAAAQDAKGTPVLVYNPVCAVRDDRVLVPVEGDYIATDEAGNVVPCQMTQGGTLLYAVGLPPMGCKLFYLQQQAPKAVPGVRDENGYYLIDTAHYEVEIHKASGRITTLLDKVSKQYVVRRECIGWRLKNGCLNTLQIHDEEPTEMSSWTIGSIRAVHNLLDGAKASIVEDGPACKRLRFEHRYAASTIRQDILIYPDSPRIDIETEVDWQEYGDFDRDAPMLKVAFSPDVQNTTAVYEIPYDTIERIAGDYEVPGLRWVDISDGEHGFAVLNDSKYGHKCRGNAMELTLIRSGWLPDHKSDVGHHRFTYAILPHAGDWHKGDVMAQAAFLNNPAPAILAGPGRVQGGIVSLEGDTAAVVCGVKRSEAGDDIILRVYNPSGDAVQTRAITGFAMEKAALCDLLERAKEEGVDFGESHFMVTLAPRQLKSYRITPRS